jgi:hypothetical protein
MFWIHPLRSQLSIDFPESSRAPAGCTVVGPGQPCAVCRPRPAELGGGDDDKLAFIVHCSRIGSSGRLVVVIGGALA